MGVSVLTGGRPPMGMSGGHGSEGLSSAEAGAGGSPEDDPEDVAEVGDGPSDMIASHAFPARLCVGNAS